MKESVNYNTPLEIVSIYTNALNERSKQHGYNLNYATGFMWTTLRDIINEHPQISDILLEKINDLKKFAEYPNPYTSCYDPHVDYVRKDWRGNIIDVKSTRYSKLNYDCRNLVNELVSSSQLEVFKQWDTNFRIKYYTKAIFAAYEIGKQSNEGILTKLKRSCKRAIDSFAYWFVCKFF